MTIIIIVNFDSAFSQRFKGAKVHKLNIAESKQCRFGYCFLIIFAATYARKKCSRIDLLLEGRGGLTSHPQ